jgi:hypothetical protein
LEGIYFEQGSQLKSVCLNCLNEGKIKVDIPTYLRDKLYESIKNNYINKDKKAIELKANKLIEKLEKTEDSCGCGCGCDGGEKEEKTSCCQDKEETKESCCSDKDSCC